MKPFILALALILPANAQILNLRLFADTYCDLRLNGIADREAIGAAVRIAYQSGAVDPTVSYHGSPTSVGAIQAAQEIERTCPHLAR